MNTPFVAPRYMSFALPAIGGNALAGMALKNLANTDAGYQIGETAGLLGSAGGIVGAGYLEQQARKAFADSILKNIELSADLDFAALAHGMSPVTKLGTFQPTPEMAEARYKQHLAENQRGLKLRSLQTLALLGVPITTALMGSAIGDNLIGGKRTSTTTKDPYRIIR